jgi:hypothetical protein
MARPLARILVPYLVVLLMDISLPLPRAHAADAPVGVITRGGPDLVQPRASTDDLPVRYGLGFPVQLGPNTAGLFCNLRVVGKGRTDMEDGTDAFVFADLGKLSQAAPTPIARNEREQDAGTGEGRFIVKYPSVVAFWPQGAKQPDGSPHPGAGTGFAICRALSFIGKGDTLTWDMFSKPTLRCYVAVAQLAFDGHQVSVTQHSLRRPDQPWMSRNGWAVVAGGLNSAIPDDSDLLLAVEAQKDGVGRNGVCRFRFEAGEWQPQVFVPITTGGEPSLVRRADGSLVFLTRTSEDMGADQMGSIVLWRSADGGATWQELVRLPNARASTPVSVNATPDGRIFVLANPQGLTDPTRTRLWWQMDRAQLAMWQLLDSAAKLEHPQLIRDSVAEFGQLDPETMWYVDHPTSAIVRLGDGRWHGLIAYRVMAYSIHGDPVGELITPHTGCYVEETPAAEPVKPPWRF